MRKFTIFALFLLMPLADAVADCVATDKTYSSCKPGYYLQTVFHGGIGGDVSSSCVRCPAVTGTNGQTLYGTSPDKNTGAVTSCALPAGTYSDATGTYQIEGGQCPYSMRF